MNKKELNELRRNFSESSDLFTLNHVVTAFVDAEKEIRCQSSQHSLRRERMFYAYPETGVGRNAWKRAAGI